MKLSILVADRSAVTRKVIITGLLTMNIMEENVTQAEDGEQAVKLALEKEFHVILLDWKTGGETTVQKIRAGGCETPILMISNEKDPEIVRQAIRAGANNYLLKPFNSDDLRTKIEQLLIAAYS